MKKINSFILTTGFVAVTSFCLSTLLLDSSHANATRTRGSSVNPSGGSNYCSSQVSTSMELFENYLNEARGDILRAIRFNQSELDLLIGSSGLGDGESNVVHNYFLEASASRIQKNRINEELNPGSPYYYLTNPRPNVRSFEITNLQDYLDELRTLSVKDNTLVTHIRSLQTEIEQLQGRISNLTQNSSEMRTLQRRLNESRDRLQTLRSDLSVTNEKAYDLHRKILGLSIRSGVTRAQELRRRLNELQNTFVTVDNNMVRWALALPAFRMYSRLDRTQARQFRLYLFQANPPLRNIVDGINNSTTDWSATDSSFWFALPLSSNMPMFGYVVKTAQQLSALNFDSGRIELCRIMTDHRILSSSTTSETFRHVVSSQPGPVAQRIRNVLYNENILHLSRQKSLTYSQNTVQSGPETLTMGTQICTHHDLVTKQRGYSFKVIMTYPAQSDLIGLNSVQYLDLPRDLVTNKSCRQTVRQESINRLVNGLINRYRTADVRNTSTPDPASSGSEAASTDTSSAVESTEAAEGTQ